MNFNVNVKGKKCSINRTLISRQSRKKITNIYQRLRKIEARSTLRHLTIKKEKNVMCYRI
jgi:hypothetical protein